MKWLLMDDAGVSHRWLKDTSSLDDVHQEHERIANELQVIRCNFDSAAVALSPEQTREWLQRRDFSSKEAFDAFREAGGWSALPGAVAVRIDLRSITDVDVVSGRFSVNFVLVCSNFMVGNELSPIDFTCRLAAHDEFAFHSYNKKSDDSLANHSDATAFAYQFQHAKDMTFFEDFELQHYPFDVQFCSIAVTCTTKGKFLIPVPGLLNQSNALDQYDMLRPWMEVYDSTSGAATTAVFRFPLQVGSRE
uniref:Uncharacterized protein n=1 Tax=Haptolina brevifila TaxID=156173 RepID=A0A7S2DAN4_9EUKA|mmetsp:Transcript_3551/g.7680  ORF Transcript_3551/g.7680 Transcript_3551/m.7680 type:complete len:249 (+) Transcript_3551:57-803(+)